MIDNNNKDKDNDNNIDVEKSEIDNSAPLLDRCSSCGRPYNWSAYYVRSDRNMVQITDPFSGRASPSKPLITYACKRCADRIAEDMEMKGYLVDQRTANREVPSSP